MARQIARRHQRERILGVLVVGLGVFVLVVAVFALREPNGHVSAAQTGTTRSNVAQHSSSHAGRPSAHRTATASSDSHSSSAVHSTPLVVLNNTSTQGLATQAAARFRAGGWTVSYTGNLVNNIISTCAYYDPAQPGARAAAEALQAQFPAIKRVEPKFAGLHPGPVVVVLTTDYSGA